LRKIANKLFNEVNLLKYERKISEAVIKRLPRYYRYLEDLVNMGISRISSKDLSARMGTTSSQVRQDFFCFGGFGLQGYGYDVEYLYQEIKNILGLNNTYNMVIIGVGHLGQAILNNERFEKRGFKTIGLFDINENLIGQKLKGIEIMHPSKLPEFTKENHVDIAIMTIPGMHAREVADLIVSCGIKAIWNFALTELSVPDDVAIENIQLSDSLMVLSYKLKEAKEAEKRAKNSGLKAKNTEPKTKTGTNNSSGKND